MRADPRHVSESRNPGRRWFIALVLLGLAVAAVMAWRIIASQESEEFSAYVVVDNETSSDLTLEARATDGRWFDVGRVGSLEQGSIYVADWLGTGGLTGVGGCSRGPVRALNVFEREVARHPGPLCEDDTWVIAAAP